ncbi:GatB/YqeY domain-containing protein [Patescibacteria group bacterium]|nr:GatB/YqeY domain-containing protein [Patescibacteria group bacterium]
MSLKDTVQEDLKVSLKARDEVRSLTLRMLLAAIVNKEKEGKEVTEEQFLDVALFEAKKRREAKEAFIKGERPELAQKEQAELEILLPYLPAQLTEEEIKDLAQKAIEKTGAASKKDMGKVMGELAPQVKGKADGALVAKIVQELLAS